MSVDINGTGIVILTGNPGSGKSLYSVDLIDQTIKLGTRPVYSNITGINIPGVQPLPADADWNNLPDKSMVIFDECQDIEDQNGFKPYAATGQSGLVRDQRLSNLRQHRKREFLLIFVSQHPTFMHHEIRKIADVHKHFLRVMGLQRSSVYTFLGSYCLSPEKPEDRRRGDKEFWKFPKRLFEKYHSATGHHIGFKMPRKVAMVAVAMLATAALGIYFMLGRAGIGSESALKTSVASVVPGSFLGGSGVSGGDVAAVPPASVEFDWVGTPSVPALAGCAVLTKSCRCFAGDGSQLALSRSQCLAVALEPLPMSFVGGAAKESGSTSPGQNADTAGNFGTVISEALTPGEIFPRKEAYVPSGGS